MAKAAELNHYPGPKHVLELAAELNLSHEQLDKTIAILGRMKSEAIHLGRELVCAEKQLDDDFKNATITHENIQKQLSEISTIRGKLREVHLRAHLDQRLVLTQEQVQQYDLLRGYAKRLDLLPHSHAPHLHI
ncbi:Uncharacterised protein [BD1-7 clade bacterium]|uniref:Uncharacterized protein n=1 Tax=BD1-7 clade bacterium TaxID=2029982 RepID=A0A5S9PHK3_9GAMM|nr:Uncharacterised protein [BD1-7 clade bacterium]